MTVMKWSRCFRIFAAAAFLTGGFLLAGPSWGFGASKEAPQMTAAALHQVSINKADLGALQSVQGVGPVVAKRIVEYREANGPFVRLEDLTQVRGIGQARFEKMKHQVTL